jgi:hypothetical protein
MGADELKRFAIVHVRQFGKSVDIRQAGICREPFAAASLTTGEDRTPLLWMLANRNHWDISPKPLVAKVILLSDTAEAPSYVGSQAAHAAAE